MKSNQKKDVLMEDKILWSVREAAIYSSIGESKIREMAKQDDCPFSLKIGRKIRIKRKEFETYLSNAKEI